MPTIGVEISKFNMDSGRPSEKGTGYESAQGKPAEFLRGAAIGSCHGGSRSIAGQHRGGSFLRFDSDFPASEREELPQRQNERSP